MKTRDRQDEMLPPHPLSAKTAQGVMAMAALTTTSTQRRIIRIAETEHLSGFKRAHIYNMMKAGRFPKSRRIGTRAVGWDSLEIEQWVAERLNAAGRA
jgi:prophage regulatory protein